MKTQNRLKSHLVMSVALSGLFGTLSFQSAFAASQANSSSLGLAGCSPQAVDVSYDGSLLVAGCAGPNGVYISHNFGSSWKLAFGGAYTSGEVSDTAMTTSTIFIRANGKIFSLPLPVDSSATTYNWQEESSLNGSATLADYGQFVVGGNYNNQILVFDSANKTLITTSDLPSVNDGMVDKITLTDTYIYVKAQISSLSGDANKKIYKATFNPLTGELGSWSDISSATGLPAGANYWNIAADPNTDILYVSARIYSDGSWSDRVYQSTDNGTNFTATSLTIGFNDACFASGVAVIHPYVSTNGGTTWTELDRYPTELEKGRFESGPCAINPANPEQAILTTNEGFDTTANLITNSGSPTYTVATTGMNSTIVSTIAKTPDNPNRVVAGTSSGVAITNNYTDTTPSWVYPVCPFEDCVHGANVLVDQSNSDILYYGAVSIDKGVVDTTTGTPVVTWSAWQTRPESLGNYSVFSMFEQLPNTIVSAFYKYEGGVNGGIMFFNTATTAATTVADSDIAGHPITAFVPANDQLMVAARGDRYNFRNLTSENLGVYYSADGGTTWESLVSTNFAADTAISVLAYDKTRDILYAGSPSISGSEAKIYRIIGFAAGSREFIAQSGSFPNGDKPEISALTIDEATGNVYLGAGGSVYVSFDSGNNWALYSAGKEGESTNTLDAESDDTGMSAVASLVGIQSTTRAGLAKGGNSGLNLLQGGSFPACTLRVSATCKKSTGVKAGTRCFIEGNAYNQVTRRALRGKKMLFQQRANSRAQWQTVSSQTIGDSGIKRLSFNAPNSTTYYRIKIPSPVCTSSVKRIIIKR